LDNSAGGTGDTNLTFNFAQIGVTLATGEDCQLLFRSGTSGAFSVLQTVNYTGGDTINFLQDNPTDGFYIIGRAVQVDLAVSKQI